MNSIDAKLHRTDSPHASPLHRLARLAAWLTLFGVLALLGRALAAPEAGRLSPEVTALCLLGALALLFGLSEWLALRGAEPPAFALALVALPGLLYSGVSAAAWPMADHLPTAGLALVWADHLWPLLIAALAVPAGLWGLRTCRELRRQCREAEQINAALQEQVDQRTRSLLKEISARERLGANLTYAAQHDPLTGLPNRALFNELLVRAVADQEHGVRAPAVIVLDLDDFKTVNDTLGHTRGDQIIKALAERLEAALDYGDVLARQGGDEFFVLLADARDREVAAQAAQRLLDALQQELVVDGRRLYLAASIGVALSAGAGDSTDLIERADAALHQAKSRGRNRIEFFEPQLHHAMTQRVTLRSALAEAIGARQLEVHYQPRVDLDTGRMSSAEALVRWCRPDHGYVTPEVFVRVAEDAGLINALGQAVLTQVCEDLARWQAAGPIPAVSFNASAHQFRDDRLLHDVRAALAEHPALAHALEVELTERVLIEDPAEHRRMLTELVDMGLGIAIDDFGTGFSSFAYFLHFPVQTVKIDQSFVSRLPKDAAAARIVRSIIELGHNFSLRVVAEGIENERQRDQLRAWGCHEGQGYLFSEPLPAAEFEERWVATLR
ncbi:EAL domain-containing protein [Ectothiorhodospiraceae bacterium 2226]|nr:EAL domain-containing protein [Ectothiorhodospiraceae bacterium 2226]